MPKLPESAVRFSDAQMRDEPDLVAAAVRYAGSYVGDWDVMLAARQLVVQTGTLPVAVARTVANCARSDPRYILAMAGQQSYEAQGGTWGDSARRTDNVVPLRGCPHVPAHWKDCCQARQEEVEPAFPFQFHPSDPRHLHDFNAAGYCRNRACNYEPEQAHDGLPKLQRLTRLRFKHRYYWSTHQGAYRTHILDPRESYAVWTRDGARFQIHGWCHAVVTHWTTGNEPPAGRTVCPGCEKAEARAVAEVAAQVFDTESNQGVQ